MTILQILNRLADTPSTNGKLVILQEHKDNETLENVFRLAYTTQIRFWIKKRPVIVETYYDKISLIDALFKLEYDVASRAITGDNAIDYVGYLLGLLSEDDKEVLYRVIERDLRCGTGTSLANKVWRGLILDYPVLLCNKFNTKTEKKIDWKKGWILQKKMDSSRINFEFDKRDLISVSTRNGTVIDIKHFQDIKVPNLDHIIIDGELMCSVDSNDLDRKTSSGIIDKAIKGTITEEDAKLLKLVAWDVIPYIDFINRNCHEPYTLRFNKLKHLISDIETDRIECVESSVVYSKEEALQQYNGYIENGFEGCILKNPEGIWSDKRSNDYLKMKAEDEFDGEIVDVIEGTGKYKGMLGAFSVKSFDGVIRFNVGSGFTDAERVEYYDKELIGKICSVKYNQKIQSKDGSWSLFLPIFDCIRFDKTQADSIDTVK